MGFNFKSLGFIANCPQPPWSADILAIVTEMGDYSEINTNNGVWGKRAIVLLDWSMADEKIVEKDKTKWGTKMNATLWGEIAKKPTFDEGDLIGIRNVGISEF